MNEAFVKMNGIQHYLWRAVDQNCEVVGVFLQKRRSATVAKHVFKRLFQTYGGTPRKIVTDKLGSYRVAHRELIHDTTQYANNLAELSHQPTRIRERVVRRFKSSAQAQQFLDSHAAAYNLFTIWSIFNVTVLVRNIFCRHRTGAFTKWNNSVV
jgi:putative transposase